MWNRLTCMRRPWRVCCLLLFLLPTCSRLPRPALLPQQNAAQDLTSLGQVYQAQGKHELALQTYYKAVQMYSSYVPAWVEIGNWHYLRQEYAQAEAVYKKILTLDPRMAAIYNNLCWVYLSTHRSLDEAERLIKRALSLNPLERYMYLDTQAVIWIRQGKDGQALASLEEALELTPLAAHDALVELYQHLAEVYRHLGQDREAQWAQGDARHHTSQQGS